MKNNRWIIGAACLVVLYYLTHSKLDESDTTNVLLQEDDSVVVHFADSNMVDIDKIGLKESTVKLNTSSGNFLQFSNVSFMRFDIVAKNMGAYDEIIKITSVKIVDANNVLLAPNIVSTAFHCILNKPQTVTQGHPYIWVTDESSGCGKESWISTPMFESTVNNSIVQPLQLVISAAGQHTNIFGITKIEEKDTKIRLEITKN